METNEVGRRRRSRDEIELMAKEFRASGLSQREFAHKVGVHPLTVCNWVRITFGSRSAVSEVSSGMASPFVAVQIRTGSAGSSCSGLEWPEVVSPSGWRLRIPPGTEYRWVGELLTQLPRC